MSAPEDPTAQKSRRGLVRLLHATGYSWAGLRAAWAEAAFRQEVVIAVLLLPLAFVLGRSWIEQALLAASVLWVLIVELLNTGIEAVVASTAVPVDPPVVTVDRGGPRRVRLAVSRIDPWSVMKMSFLFSVALGIAGVVMTALLWSILNGLGIFSDIDRIIQDNQLASATPIHILDYVGFRRVVSMSVVVGVINVVLMTAIATLASFLYNISSSLVGGVQLTLTDD